MISSALSLLVVQLCALLPSPFLIGVDSDDGSRYQWVRAIPQGNGREEARWQEGTWPNIHAQPVVLNDTLLIIGSRHTWKSSDGIQWKAFLHDGKWGTRYGASHIVYDGKIWIMGGGKHWERFENDVWSSGDGLHWTLITSSAPWTARRGHAALVYKEKMWIVGGAESSGRPDVLPTRSLDDVWISTDGKTWKCVGWHAPWQAEYSKAFFSTSMSGHVFDEKLWVIGGPRGNSVWYSTDGGQWTMATEQASWAPRYARGSGVFSSMLWVFGGPGLNDVWCSRDGKSWDQLTNAQWSSRAPGYTVVFQGRLWMFGGKTGRSGEGNWGDDVWYLQDFSSPPSRISR